MKNDDLRKYMGLDDAPCSRLKLATGGSAKKKQKLGDAIAGTLGALGTLGGLGAAYMSHRNNQKKPQPDTQNFNPQRGGASQRTHGRAVIANPGYDENVSNMHDSGHGAESGAAAARRMHAMARKARGLEPLNHVEASTKRVNDFNDELKNNLKKNNPESYNKYLNSTEPSSYRSYLEDKYQ